MFFIFITLALFSEFLSQNVHAVIATFVFFFILIDQKNTSLKGKIKMIFFQIKHKKQFGQQEKRLSLLEEMCMLV